MTAGADLLVDGTVAVSTFSLGTPTAVGNVSVKIGLAGVNAPSNGWKVYFDDVTFDEK